ncbi:hypothetical protein BRD17_08620 [Halobacteriales archaeon SW_7_68_16]|nr:MAG: hypothetical protein BRD17_08620 [Halobacteriales archaeon SW_7_68_16]
MDREKKIDVIVSTAAVVAMIGVMLAIGTAYTTNGTISPSGGQALAAAIALFVVLMTVVGYALAVTRGDDQGDDHTANGA